MYHITLCAIFHNFFNPHHLSQGLQYSFSSFSKICKTLSPSPDKALPIKSPENQLTGASFQSKA